MDAGNVPGLSWTADTLGSLAYCLFALQQPGPLADLMTREQAQAEGLLTPRAALGPEPDPFLRRQNVLGEISLLDL